MGIIGNARQATSEGKSGLVETRLTGLAATALLINHHLIHHHLKIFFLQKTVFDEPTKFCLLKISVCIVFLMDKCIDILNEYYVMSCS